MNISGSLGLGLTNPSASLHISGASSANLLRIDSPASSNILFVTGSGRVAVGTTTPQRLFDVYNGSTSGIVASFGAQFANGNFSGISFGYVEQANALYRKSALVFERSETHGGGSNASGKIHFLLNNSTSNSATSLTDSVVTIDSVGSATGSARMGIGTRFPTASLHVSGTVATDNLMRVQSTTGAEYFFISASGNVGIGTSTPLSKLHVRAATDQNLRVASGTTLEVNSINDADSAYTPVTFRASSYNFANGNVGIGETSPGARLEVKGSGTTSATTALRVENANQSASLVALDNGLVGIGIIPTSASLHVNGNAYISASFSTSSAALTVYKSGSTVLDVQGSQGQLFSITDSLSGSLFSVNDISGLPILEVFSDNTILMGDYIAPSLNTTEKLTVNSGITTLYAVPTASYDSAIFEYNIRSGSNARAGSITGIWSGSSVNFTETTTTDFGSTAGFVLGMSISGANMILSSSAATSGWTFKTIIRSI
jgi:hypothetical protein